MKLQRVLFSSALVPAYVALIACTESDPIPEGSGGSSAMGGAGALAGTAGVGGAGTAGTGVAGKGGTAGTGAAGVGGAAGAGTGGLGGAGSAGLGGTAGAGAAGVSGTAGAEAGGGAGLGGTAGAGSAGDAGFAGTAGTAGSAGSAGTTFVEDEGTDCAVSALPDSGGLPTVAKLPDPFTKLDGQRMTMKSEWRCRRQEIKKQAEKYMYGEKPPKPEMVTGTVSSTSITVNVAHGGESTSFTVSVQLPTGGTPPYPALVSLGSGFFGFSHNDFVRGEGVAVIEYDPYAVGSESTPRNNKTGAFYDIYGSDSDTGLLVAWGWGVSRIIDVINEFGSEILKADAVAVAGCSRFGKGAFVVGAFDQRIALTIPFESGSAGVPIWRGIPGEGAQSPSSAYGEEYWLGDGFEPFQNAVTKLPLDTHAVVAMVAPRGLLVLDNPHIANLGPESAHVAALAGAEVYKAIGAEENISYHSAVASGSHCEARPEHQTPLREAVRKHLLKTGTTAGSIQASGSATGNLADWREWTTPTLN
jgi:hypothetical protein